MQDMEEQLISRLLEQGMVKSDAGRGAQRLRHSLEAVRKAEAAIEKLKRSLNRQQVAESEALPPMHPDAGTVCQRGVRVAPATARRSPGWQRRTVLVNPEVSSTAVASCCPASLQLTLWSHTSLPWQVWCCIKIFLKKSHTALPKKWLSQVFQRGSNSGL